MLSGVSKTLPGLKNFDMVGQWASGMIGLPNTAAMGRAVIIKLCRKDGKKFTTSPVSTGSRLAADAVQ
jgi:hypothetical protein